jgi:peptidoglycan/xylan/chitin deacetylase (PgdA/CDA1 family)
MANLSKKDALAHVLNRSGAFAMQRGLRLLPANQFVVLTYHRIAELDAPGEYPFDADLISASPAQFDWQMGLLNECFQPQRLGTLLQMCRENRGIPAGSVAVTFDDGFLDNYAAAYPILRKHGIPATFFVTTDFVEHDRPIWFEVVAFAFLSLTVASIRHPLCAHPMPSDVARKVRLGELRQTMQKLKLAPDAQRTAFVDHLLTLVDSAALMAAWKRFGGAMSWQQVIEVSQNNVEIGSHTVSHPILSKLEGQMLLGELSRSKRTLEQKIGATVDLLAYPVGGRAHFSPDVVRAAQAAGYGFGISYVAGTNRSGQIDPFFVRRHTVERDMTRERFEAQLCLPGIFS